MRSILSEKSLVAVLFVMVLITFSLAQEDSRKMEKAFTGAGIHTTSTHLSKQSKIAAEELVAKQLTQKSETE